MLRLFARPRERWGAPPPTAAASALALADFANGFSRLRNPNILLPLLLSPSAPEARRGGDNGVDAAPLDAWPAARGICPLPPRPPALPDAAVAAAVVVVVVALAAAATVGYLERVGAGHGSGSRGGSRCARSIPHNLVQRVRAV